MFMRLREPLEKSLTGRLSKMKAEMPEVEALSYILTGDQLREWALTVGVATDEGLRAIVPSVPPLDMRTIVAAPSEPVFLWSGFRDAQSCVAMSSRLLKKSRPLKVLDFGCGCGRVSRFIQELPNVELSGTDVNAKLVDWCQENLKNTRTTLNGPLPPLPLEDECFDFIYSFSIFSHLPEGAMLRWLAELARVTATGGILMLTTHGSPALDIIAKSEVHQSMFRVDQHEVERIRAEFNRAGFVYLPYDADVLSHANAGDDYGNSFIHHDYISRRWCESGLTLIEHIEGGMRGWQDVSVLRKI